MYRTLLIFITTYMAAAYVASESNPSMSLPSPPPTHVMKKKGWDWHTTWTFSSTIVPEKRFGWFVWLLDLLSSSSFFLMETLRAWEILYVPIIALTREHAQNEIGKPIHGHANWNCCCWWSMQFIFKHFERWLIDVHACMLVVVVHELFASVIKF